MNFSGNQDEKWTFNLRGQYRERSSLSGVRADLFKGALVDFMLVDLDLRRLDRLLASVQCAAF